MLFFLIFLILFLVLFSLYFGGTIYFHNWLYSSLPNSLWQRSAIAAAGTALFFVFWAWLHYLNPDRFGMLFEFSKYEMKDFNQIESVRLVGDREEIIPYHKKPGGIGTSDYLDARKAHKPNPWARSDANSVMIAILIREENRDQPTRFEVKLDAQKRFPPNYLYQEVGGSRYIDPNHIGRVIRPRGSTVFLNIILTLLHGAIWYVALWIGLQFESEHALGLTLVLWLAFTIIILPVLFGQVRSRSSPARVESKAIWMVQTVQTEKIQLIKGLPSKMI